MKPQVKKVLAVLLVVGVGGTWIPQLLSADSKSKPPPLPEVAADGTRMAPDPTGTAADAAGTSGSEVAPSADSRPKSAAATSAASGSTSTPAGDSDAALERSIALAQSLMPSKSSLDLDALARAWSAENDEPAKPTKKRSKKPDAEPEGESAPPPSRAKDEGPSAPPVDPIEAFLAAHPLRGTIVGETRKVASLGALVVTEGQELVAGLRLVEIGDRFVVVESTRGRARIELAPFQTRPKSESSSVEKSDSPATAAASGKPGATPATPVTPAPAPAAEKPAPADETSATTGVQSAKAGANGKVANGPETKEPKR